MPRAIEPLFRHRMMRFLFSGGVGVATVMLLLYIFTELLGFWYLLSFAIAFFFGTCVSFALQKFFTFGDDTLGARRVSGQAALYLTLATFNLGANGALLFLLVEFGGIHYLLAQFLVSLLIAVWNFLCYRVIFRAIEIAETSAQPIRATRTRFPRELLLPLGACVLAIILAFSISGVYNDRIDTGQYVAEIEAFQAYVTTGESISGRAMFKPLPGIVGGTLSFVMHPYTALLLINLVLYVGFILAFYGVLHELSFRRLEAAIGASWVALGYPVLKYGLGLGTDAWGWFAATLVAYLVLNAVRTERLFLVALASIAGFLGSLAKETAVLGLLFAGLYLLTRVRAWGISRTLVWAGILSIPFFVLQAALIGAVVAAGGPTFLDWYMQNDAEYTAGYHNLPYFVGVMFSTFSMLLMFAFFGFLAALKSRDAVRYEWLSRFVPLLLGTIPILMWPIFISRIIYIQVLWIVPLALAGAIALVSWRRLPRPFAYLIYALPPAAAIGLYMISGNGSLLEVLTRLV